MVTQVPIAEMEAAGDLTTAMLIEQPGSESQKAVDGRVIPIAAGIIASDPAIKAGAAAAAEQAANDLNAIRAYPETAVQKTGAAEVPMQWVQRTLRDPYRDTYSDIYEAEWVGDTPTTGDLPVLTEQGKLNTAHIPDEYPNTDRVRQMIDTATPAAPPVARRRVTGMFPVFGGRVAQARITPAPTAVVIAGSSSSAESPGYVADLTTALQALIPVQAASNPQWNTEGIFTTNTTPGIHVYSAARVGARSSNYMDTTKQARIAALKPALLHHMIGANDYRDRVPVATYKANVEAALNSLDALITEPCQHVLWHPYPPQDITPTIPWAAYGDALKEIADSRPNTVFVDMSPQFAANGIPGTDPLKFLRGDRIHQTPTGYAYMADLMTSIYLI